VSYRWVDHTAELELHVEAPTPELVLQHALRAFAELAGPASGPPQAHEVELEAPDLAALLARWLEELVFLAETEGLVPEEADIVLCNTSLRAAVRGRTGAPRPLVKAVTYHGLAFAHEGGSWRARVVLDV
jgi:SHS2 domain-containing protein